MSRKLKHPEIRLYLCDHAGKCKRTICGHKILHKPEFNCENTEKLYYCEYVREHTVCR